LVGLFRELPDLSITSFGIPWDQAVPVANCALNELAGYVYDEQNRVKLQNTPQMDLVSLVETSKFCTAGCALPYCRAKVREPTCQLCTYLHFWFGVAAEQVEESNVTVREGVTLYKCGAKRPHLCLTFCWRFMCQGQFKLSGQEEVRACASRASAASLDVHLPGCLAVQIFTMWLRDPAVATIMRMSGDEFSVLTPQQKVETAAARRSGGTYTASIACERPSGNFNGGKPVLYCTKLTASV
jgi:hypothetical protein